MHSGVHGFRVRAYPPKPDGYEEHDMWGRPLKWSTARIWALEEVAREEGFLLCPEGAATYAAYKAALADGHIRRDERAVLFNCATGLKYPLPPVHRTLDRNKPIDYASL